MSELKYRKLDPDEIDLALTRVPGWIVSDGEITKHFKFKTYKDGLVFAVAVGYLADCLDHHPTIVIEYGKVGVSMNTHDVAGISPFDFELARRIEEIV